MTELSADARCAIEALQQHTANDDERGRVRARLAALGVAVVAGGATTTLAATVAAASVSATSVPPVSLAGAAGAAAAPVGSTLSAGSGVLSGAGLLAKVASVPLALKAGALVAVVAGASAIALPAVRSARAPRTGQLAEPAENRPEPRRSSASKPAPGPALTGTGLVAPSTDVTPALEAAPAADPAAAASAREFAAPERVARSAATPAREVASGAAGAPGRRATSAEAASESSSLDAESALLSGALRALRAGQLERARTLLDDHESKFGPHALLARERERMRGELPPSLR